MRIWLLLLLISTVCSAQKDIDFIITDKVLTDSIVNFKVVNNSSVTYVLPIMIFPEHEKISTVVGAGDRCLFFIHPIFYDESGAAMDWFCNNCFPFHDEDDEKETIRLTNLWRERVKNLKLADLIILKPKETRSFNVAFSPVIKVTSKSIFQLIDENKDGKHYIGLSYYGENTTYPPAILPILDRLAEKENYKIYKGGITSNKVLLKK